MDLNAPLGMTPPPPERARRFVLLVGGVLGASVLGGIALVLAWGDPRGGRPSVVADLPSPLPPAPPRPPALDATPTGTLPPAGASPPNARAGSLEGGVMVYRGTSGAGTPEQTQPAVPAAAPGPLVIDVSRALDDPLGRARAGKPVSGKLAPGSASPGIATPGASAVTPKVPPRIAIFVSGMGLDAGATRTAIETMPPAVTLAFLPYGSKVGTSVADAKVKGHEVLLQLPMRNEGGGSPGPHALRPDSPPDAFKGDLAWLMDRFSGYDGVANLLGAPVTADAPAMTIVLKTLAARHLFYLDDGTSRGSVATGLASDLGAEAVKTDLVLDATSDPAVVRANLDKLVTLAKRNGHAVGMASGLPEHLGTIARFAADIGAKGATLVPVAALAHAPDPTQAAATR